MCLILLENGILKFHLIIVTLDCSETFTDCDIILILNVDVFLYSLQRGALPMLRNSYGLSFVALQLNQPLEKQLLAVDVILHKATDEIVSVNPGHFGTLASIEFSQGIQNLQR